MGCETMFARYFSIPIKLITLQNEYFGTSLQFFEVRLTPKLYHESQVTYETDKNLLSHSKNGL